MTIFSRNTDLLFALNLIYMVLVGAERTPSAFLVV